MLSAKGDLPSFAGRAPNPTVDLPVSAKEIVDDIDGVIVGHLHPDHFNAAAVALLDKNLAIVTPNNSAPVDPRDPLNTLQSFKEQLNEYGFENVTTLSSERVIEFMGVRLTQEFGQHGFGDTVPLMGGVNGIIFQATEAPTIYWTSDSVLDQEGQVLEILERYRPDVVIAHTGGAMIPGLSDKPILMNSEQAVRFFAAADAANPEVQTIAVHMNALDHCFTTREILRNADSEMSDGLRQRIFIPEDGELVKLGGF